MYDSNNVVLSKENIMRTFFEKVAGRAEVSFGGGYSIMPLNYKTDEKEVIVEGAEVLPLLDLRHILKYSSMEELRKDRQATLPNGSTEPEPGQKLYFEDVLTEYVRTYFASEKNWTTPIKHCKDKEDQLVFCLANLWLNATVDDYENPIAFVRRYTDFIKDQTFEDFYRPRLLRGIQTLKNCDIEIKLIEQEEFQETPQAIQFTVRKETAEKKLPKIAYGISGDKAYVYAIQGFKTEEDEKEIKQVNRARYGVNREENYPEGYENVFRRQEPYAYISLFTFLSMLKAKGINRVYMPSFLPERYESKEMLSKRRVEEGKREIAEGAYKTRKERKKEIRELDQQNNDHQRIQYNITNKFLYYMSKMTCDAPGIKTIATPEESNGFLVVDISHMLPDPETNIIFYELYKKYADLKKNLDRENER